MKPDPNEKPDGPPQKNGEELAAGKELSSARRNGDHGRIQSLDDVVLTLGEVCKYYEVHDRSSPVPLLLKRIQRMAKMNFTEIMGDLTSEEIAKLKSTPMD